MSNSSEKETEDLNKSKEGTQGEASKNLDQVGSSSAQDASLILEREVSQNLDQVSSSARDVSLILEREISQNSERAGSSSAQNAPLNISTSSLSAIAGLLTGHVQSSVSLDGENVNITLSFPKSYFTEIYLALEKKLTISKPDIEEMRSIASNTEQSESGMDRMENISCISAGFTEDAEACEGNAANDSRISESDVFNKGNMKEIDKSTTMTNKCEISSEQSIVTHVTSICLKGKASSNKDSDKSQSASMVAERPCFDKDIRNEKDADETCDETLSSNSCSQTDSSQSENIVAISETISMECASPCATAAIMNKENESNVLEIDKTMQNIVESVCSTPLEVVKNASANFVSNEVEMRTSVLEVNTKTGESCEETSYETLLKSNSASVDISGFQIEEQASTTMASKKHEVLNTSKAGEKRNLEVGNLDSNGNFRNPANVHTQSSSLNSSDNQRNDISETSLTPKDTSNNLSLEFQSVLMASHSSYEIRDSAPPRLPSMSEITVVPTREINTASPSSVKYFELDLPEHFVFVKVTSREGDISIDAAKYKKDISASGGNSEKQQTECSRNLSVENKRNESGEIMEHKPAEEARSEVTETKPQISTGVRAKNLNEMANILKRDGSQELLNLHQSRMNVNHETLGFGSKLLSEIGIELDSDPLEIMPYVTQSENDSSMEISSSDKNLSLEIDASDSTSDVVIIDEDSVKQFSTIDIDSVTEVSSDDCIGDSNVIDGEFVGSNTVEEKPVDDTVTKGVAKGKESDTKTSGRVEEIVIAAQDSTVVESVKTDYKPVVYDETADNSEQVTKGVTSLADSEQGTEGETAFEDSEQVTEGATFPDDSEQETEGETAKNCERIKSAIDAKDLEVAEDISLVEDTDRVIKVTTDLYETDVTTIESSKKIVEVSVAKTAYKEPVKNTSDVDAVVENLEESEGTGQENVGISSEDSGVLKDDDVKLKVCKKETEEVTVKDHLEEGKNNESNISKHSRKYSMHSEGNAAEIRNNSENLDSTTRAQVSEPVDVSTGIEEIEDIHSCQNIERESSDAPNTEYTSDYLEIVPDDPSEELSNIELDTDNTDWVLKVSEPEDNERSELSSDEENKLLELSTAESAADVARIDLTDAVDDDTPTKHSAGVTKEASKNTLEAFANSSNTISRPHESDSISIKDVEDKYISNDSSKRQSPRNNTTMKHTRNAAMTLEKEIENVSLYIISNDETCISETKHAEEIQLKHGSRYSSASSSDSDKANEESEEELYELYKVNKSQNEESIKEEFSESDQNVSEGKSEFLESMNATSYVAEKPAADPNESFSEAVASISDLNISERKDETCDKETGEVSTDESFKDVTAKPLCDEKGNLREPTSTERKQEDLNVSSKTEYIDTPISSVEIGGSVLKPDSKNSNVSTDQSFDVVDAAPTRVRGKKFPAPPLSQDVIPEDKDGKSRNKESSKGDSQNKNTSVEIKSPGKRSLRSSSQEPIINTSLSGSKMPSRGKPNEDLEISRESSVEREKISTRKKRENTPDIKIKERVAVGFRSSPRKATLKAAADSSTTTSSKIELSTPHNTRMSSQMSSDTRSTNLRSLPSASTASMKKSKRGSKEK